VNLESLPFPTAEQGGDDLGNEGQGRGQRRRRHEDEDRPLIVDVAQLVLDLARVWEDIIRLARRTGIGSKAGTEE
jgi:hypothetical protein